MRITCPTLGRSAYQTAPLPRSPGGSARRTLLPGQHGECLVAVVGTWFAIASYRSLGTPVTRIFRLHTLSKRPSFQSPDRGAFGTGLLLRIRSNDSVESQLLSSIYGRGVMTTMRSSVHIAVSQLTKELQEIALAELGHPRVRIVPKRWIADPHWRCTELHVGVRFNRDSRGLRVCPVIHCGAPVLLTFPEDVSGPLA